MHARWPSGWPARKRRMRRRRCTRQHARRRDAGLDARQAGAAGAHPRAKAELEAEARRSRSRQTAAAEGSGRQPQTGRADRRHPPGQPKPKSQRNFTDPQSRIMKARDGFIQAYNAQAAVDADAQIIVAHRLTNNGSDQDALLALLDAVRRTPARCQTRSPPITAIVQKPISKASTRARCAAMWRPGAPAPDGGKKGGKLVQAMRARIGKADTQSIPYAKIHRRTRIRTHQTGPRLPPIPPPRHRKVRAEWAMICTAHNLAKLTT